MLRHHEVEFAQFIETIYTDAAATVRWDRVYHWFGAERITKTVWQAIKSAWAEACDFQGYDEVPTLHCFKLPNALTITRDKFSDEDVTDLAGHVELTAETD